MVRRHLYFPNISSVASFPKSKATVGRNSGAPFRDIDYLIRMVHRAPQDQEESWFDL